MATEKQIRANKLNALRSTGPRTSAGKATSSRNALQHGLTSQQIILPGEDPELFGEMRQRLLLEFAPWGAMEEGLVEQLASTLWRLRRVPVLEAAILAWLQSQQEAYDDPVEVMLGEGALTGEARSLRRPETQASADEWRDYERLALGRAMEVAMREGDYLSKLSRYEEQLLRMMEKTLATLRSLQAHRPTEVGLLAEAVE